MSNFFEKPFNKKSFGILLVVLWVAFSVYYIINDQWTDFKTREVERAYQKGVADSVKSLTAQLKDCKPVPLFDGVEKAEVISIKCLQEMSKQENNKAEK